MMFLKLGQSTGCVTSARRRAVLTVAALPPCLLLALLTGCNGRSIKPGCSRWGSLGTKRSDVLFHLCPHSFCSNTTPASVVELISVCADESLRKNHTDLSFLLVYDLVLQPWGTLTWKAGYISEPSCCSNCLWLRLWQPLHPWSLCFGFCMAFLLLFCPHGQTRGLSLHMGECAWNDQRGKVLISAELSVALNLESLGKEMVSCVQGRPSHRSDLRKRRWEI